MNRPNVLKHKGVMSLVNEIAAAALLNHAIGGETDHSELRAIGLFVGYCEEAAPQNTEPIHEILCGSASKFPERHKAFEVAGEALMMNGIDPDEANPDGGLGEYEVSLLRVVLYEIRNDNAAMLSALPIL